MEKKIRRREIQGASPGIIQWKGAVFLNFFLGKENGCKIGDKNAYFLILLLAGSLILDKSFNLSES